MPLYLKQAPLFNQPLPFYGKNLNPTPFWEVRKLNSIKEGISNYDVPGYELIKIKTHVE